MSNLTYKVTLVLNFGKGDAKIYRHFPAILECDLPELLKTLSGSGLPWEQVCIIEIEKRD